MAIVFADTNIIIEYLKDNETIKNTLSHYETIYINDVVIMELYQGARNKQELAYIKKNISQFVVLEMHQSIVQLAREILEQYTLSHNMKIMDALIASTVMMYKVELYTLNKKDFKYLNQVTLVK